MPGGRQRRSSLQPRGKFVVRLGRSTMGELECAAVAQIAAPSGEGGTTRRLVQPGHEYRVRCPQAGFYSGAPE
jgi:hypothetical protein